MVVIDEWSRRAWVHGSPIRLTWTEFEILALLAATPMRCISKTEMTRCLWGREYFDDGHTIESHMSRLRRKLREVDEGRTWIVTVRKAGYRLEAAGDVTFLDDRAPQSTDDPVRSPWDRSPLEGAVHSG